MIGKILGNKYEILELIGSGGMSTVYRAKHLKIDSPVAVKMVKPVLLDQDPTYKKRFIGESKISFQLNHPNIIRIYDSDEDNGNLYMVMDYIPGKTLKEIISASGPLPIDKVVRYVTQIGAALDHIHSKGLIHRDIKSSNIMIRESDDQAIIMDFGISRAADSETLTGTGTQIGTPEYMSPEQGHNRPATKLSDIYAFGVVTYEMLTGRVPFKTDTPTTTLIQHMNNPVPPLKQFRRSIPAEIESAMAKVLSKNPRDRYQSAGEFARSFLKETARSSDRTVLVKPHQQTGKSNVKMTLVLTAFMVILGILIIALALSLISGNNSANPS
jgi:serine/threonine protein kinase